MAPPSSGGLFPHYPADSGAAETAGNKATNQQATFTTLKSNLSGQEDSASQEVAGALTSPVQSSTQAPQGDAEKAGQASLVAGGATTHFAKAIKTYDGHIDDLNKKYEDAKANDFGVAADAGHTEGNTDAENDSARNGKVTAADAALKAALEKERQGFEDTLDDAADFAAAMLLVGPTEETILSLVSTGDIDLGQAATALGTTVAALNQFRMTVATAKTIQSWKDLFPALAKMDVARLEKAVMPGNLFGKSAYIPRHAAKVGKAFTAFSKLGKFAGKAFPPLAVLAGGYGLYDTISNWKGDFDDWNNAVGSGATIISGGATTLAMIGLASNPVGWTIAGVAGVIAVGSLAVAYREEIWDGIKWTGGKIGEGASWLYDKTGLDSAVEGIGEGWDKGTEWAGDRMDDVGDAIDKVTPW